MTARIESSRIYQHVLNLEGPRCPITSYDQHEKAADYIIEEMKALGYQVEIQSLTVKGFDKPLRNIIAKRDGQEGKTLLMGSHYDTVSYTPGANDNLSAVASMLELARVMQDCDNGKAVTFVFFTMEEYHPGYELTKRNRLVKQGFTDDQGRFLEHRILKLDRKMQRESKRRDHTVPYYLYLDRVIDLWEGLDERDREYMQLHIDVSKEFTLDSPSGRPSYPVGSHEFAEAYGDTIHRAIILDCLGWHKDGENSQKRPPLKGDMRQLIKLHDVDVERNVGNYVTMIGDVNSLELLEGLRTSMSYPNMTINLPFNFDQIRKSFRDALRSDHAAFWKKGIPAVFVTDLANFRSDFYHTPGDTYDQIDYDALVKIADSIYKYLKC